MSVVNRSVDVRRGQYRAICKPGTPFSIHGDVAIVNDKDFS